MGAAKAAGLNHVLALRVHGPNAGFPVTFARTDFPLMQSRRSLHLQIPRSLVEIHSVTEQLLTSSSSLSPLSSFCSMPKLARRTQCSTRSDCAHYTRGPFPAARSLLFCGIAAPNSGDRKSGALDRLLDQVKFARRLKPFAACLRTFTYPASYQLCAEFSSRLEYSLQT